MVRKCFLLNNSIKKTFSQHFLIDLRKNIAKTFSFNNPINKKNVLHFFLITLTKNVAKLNNFNKKNCFAIFF
jgi:hypothetical protein